MSPEDTHKVEDGLFVGSMRQTLFFFLQEHHNMQNELQELQGGYGLLNGTSCQLNETHGPCHVVATQKLLNYIKNLYLWMLHISFVV